MTAWVKLRALWRAGGLRAVCTSLFKALLFKRWRSLVLVHDSPMASLPLVWPADYVFVWYASVAEIPAGQRQALQRQAARGFLDDVHPSDPLYAVWHGDDLASYGAVMRRSPQMSVLGLPSGACLVGLCETLPAHQRRGLFCLALMQTVQASRDRGTHDVHVEVLESNTPSREGSLKAGFRPWARVDAQIWFGCWVRRARQWHRLVR